jgi:dihydrofolate reductase
MGTVIFDTSMSLDGFMTAADRTPEVPLGDGGEVLTQWAMDDQAGVELLRTWVEQLGASIAGRVTYDTSLPWWGPNGPSGAARRPLFVVTHQAPENRLDGAVYSFVTDGIEAALAQAQAAAGDKDVVVMGGADLGQQYLRAGLIDEVQIHLVPVVLGGGTRMFENVGRLDLAARETVRTERATHLRFRVRRASQARTSKGRA